MYVSFTCLYVRMTPYKYLLQKDSNIWYHQCYRFRLLFLALTLNKILLIVLRLKHVNWSSYLNQLSRNTPIFPFESWDTHQYSKQNKETTHLVQLLNKPPEKGGNAKTTANLNCAQVPRTKERSLQFIIQDATNVPRTWIHYDRLIKSQLTLPGILPSSLTVSSSTKVSAIQIVSLVSATPIPLLIMTGNWEALIAA